MQGLGRLHGGQTVAGGIESGYQSGRRERIRGMHGYVIVTQDGGTKPRPL
jgi:hypothetical protein